MVFVLGGDLGEFGFFFFFFFSENVKKREEFLEIFSPVLKIKILN
jgi:hypothetical protein